MNRKRWIILGIIIAVLVVVIVVVVVAVVLLKKDDDSSKKREGIILIHFSEPPFLLCSFGNWYFKISMLVAQLKISEASEKT